MKNQGGLQQLTRRLQTQLLNVAAERQLMNDALANVELGTGANYADDNETLRYLNQYRQAESVRDWVWNTYVQGAQPTVVSVLDGAGSFNVAASPNVRRASAIQACTRR